MCLYGVKVIKQTFEGYYDRCLSANVCNISSSSSLFSPFDEHNLIKFALLYLVFFFLTALHKYISAFLESKIFFHKFARIINIVWEQSKQILFANHCVCVSVLR